MFLTQCAGSFGLESAVSLAGPGITLLLLVIAPLGFAIPQIFAIRELQSLMPGEGGYYHWVKQALGPFAGYMAGWMNWTMSWVDVSIYPVLAAYYLAYFIPALSSGLIYHGRFYSGDLLSWIVGLLIIWTITAVHIRSVKTAGISSNVLTVILLVPLYLVAVFGIYNWIRDGFQVAVPFLAEGKTFTAAMATGLFVVMWNYFGWELSAVAGDEIVNPKKTYPRALAMVLGAVLLTYSSTMLGGILGGAGDGDRYKLWGLEDTQGANVTEQLRAAGVSEETMLHWGVDPDNVRGWQFPQVAQAVGERTSGQAGSPLSKFLGLSVMIAAVTSMIGLYLGNSLHGTRVPFAMAADGMFPRFLAKVHPQYGTPWISIMFSAIIYTIFTLKPFAYLVVADAFLSMMTLALILASVVALRVRKPRLRRNRIPFGMAGLTYCVLAPLVFIVVAVYSQLTEVGTSALFLAFELIVIGAILYIPVRLFIKPGNPDINPYTK